ncbi:MAG: SLC13 family permease [Candidatus Hodarchaeales archaeon]|jgi:Na+/H+ antiporter NhaD/arsenite permease-like protein
MTEEKKDANPLISLIQLINNKRLSLGEINNYSVSKILLILLCIIGFFLFQSIYSSSPRVAKMILFGFIFVVTFLLVAKYHHKQITIIFVSCAISLILASYFLENFRWELVVLPPHEGGYMEWEVLAVVFGMSILVEATSETGLFDWIIIRMLKISKGRVFPLFFLTFILTFALSTVLANVTAMILISSMILTVSNGLDYDPTPFLLGAVLATSLAGMATLVSSLPAIMVGSKNAGDISFIEFLIVSVPFLIICIPITIYYLKRVFPPEKIPLRKTSHKGIDAQMILSLDEWGVVEDTKRFYLAAVALGITILGFIFSSSLGMPIGVVAILGGILAIVLTQSDENRLIHELSWDTLLFFAGLFILVGTLEATEVLQDIANSLKEISGGDILIAGGLILLISSSVSGILDNIPVTAALIPIVSDFSNLPSAIAHPKYLWFMLVFGGAFGGGITPFGSAASILAISILGKEGRPLNFLYFMKRLVPISLILLAFSGIYLSFLAFVLGII